MLIQLTVWFSPQLIEVIGEAFESGFCSPPAWAQDPILVVVIKSCGSMASETIWQ